MPKPPIQIQFSKEPETDCGLCGGQNCLAEEFRNCEMVVRDETLIVSNPKTVCQKCEAAWFSLDQADRSVAIAVTAYHDKHGLLTGALCRKRRKIVGLTQSDLADKSGVGIASIKRLESGVHVLSQVHNEAIARTLESADHEMSMVPRGVQLQTDWPTAKSVWTTCEGMAEIVATYAMDEVAIDEETGYGIVDEPEPFALAS